MRHWLQITFFASAVFCLPVVALAATKPAPATDTPLTAKQIQTTFGTGTPFSSSTTTGTTYVMVLNKDGTASRTPKKGKAIAGKWTASKDEYCSTWGKGT